MKTKVIVLQFSILVCVVTGYAQVDSLAPAKFVAASPVGFLAEGRPDQDNAYGMKQIVRNELLDSNVITPILRSLDLSQQEKDSVVIAPSSVDAETGVWLYELTNIGDAAFSRIAARINQYADARLDGHTKKFILSGLTNKADVSFSDTHLQLLRRNFPLIPITSFKAAGSGIITNGGNEFTVRLSDIANLTSAQIARKGKLNGNLGPLKWVSFVVVDDEVGWRYVITYKGDDSLYDIRVSKFDTQEIDPALQKIFDDVDKEVENEMKVSGDAGKLGSVKTYWRLKKALLKERGIQWRSPDELNSGIFE